MREDILQNYAKLVVKMGLNVQEGQVVKIHTSTNNVQFARLLTKEAYDLKASKVIVEFSDEEITRYHYEYRSLEVLSKVEQYEEEIEKYNTDQRVNMIYIEDEDPDFMNGIDSEKMMKSRQARYPIIKPYRDERENQIQWVIVALPSLKWAKKVFPNETDERAMELLDEAIVKCTRLEGNAIENWENHVKTLDQRAISMNDYHFDSLVFSSKNGTNLSVGLHPNHDWLSAFEKTLSGIKYCCNMPTEEIFTMPDKYRVNGKVVSTKPLSYLGNLIENFSMQFKDGKAIKCEAQVGQKFLEEIISMDESAAYLGEVALVPMNSPINQSGILFYNTLFDENASCHIALGMGIKSNLLGFEQMSDDDFVQQNWNDSMIHVDFMIGSEDMDIVGIMKDGERVQVFKDGNWAF